VPVTLLDDLPGMGHANCRVDLVANGAKGFVRTSDCAARLDLESGRMDDLKHRLDYECQQLVGTWQHGAVCRVGKNFERLAIVDLRND
jgi:hypothetical protein